MRHHILALFVSSSLFATACAKEDGPTTDDSVAGKVAGSYSCKATLTKSVVPPTGPTTTPTSTRLRDTVLTVGKLGRDSISLYGGLWVHTTEQVPGLPPSSSGTQFESRNISTRAIAHFYNTGDSVYIYFLYYGNRSDVRTYTYRGVRRP